MGLGLRLRIWDEPNPVHLAGKTGKNQEKSDKNGILRINPGSSTLPGRIQHQIRGFSHSQIRPKNSNKTFQPPPKKPQIYGKLLQLFLKNSFKCSKISNSGFIPENRRKRHQIRLNPGFFGIISFSLGFLLFSLGNFWDFCSLSTLELNPEFFPGILRHRSHQTLPISWT